MRPYAPLGLLYISAYLNENNVENHVYDSTFYSKEAQLKFIEEKQEIRGRSTRRVFKNLIGTRSITCFEIPVDLLGCKHWRVRTM